MTCIIGLEHQDHVYIGADSASADGWLVRHTRLPKVFRCGCFIIGYTSSFRMGQILQFHLDVPVQDGEPDEQFMVVNFVEAVRSCLKEKGFAKVENNVEEGGSFLIGYKNRLYHCEGDFQVNSCLDGVDACGCGQEFALGAMKALDQFIADPVKRIKEALKIVAYFSGGVCAPFKVLKL